MTTEGPSRVKIAAAFATVYVIWGSTYLAILYAIETLPPMLMASARFLLAGGIMFAWARARGDAMPTRSQWIACAIGGLLMLMVGNGSVVWAETRVPSGVAALIVAIVPCWMVLLEWLRGGERPTGQVIAGLALGLVGLGLLIGPEGFMGGERIDMFGAGVLVIGGFAWAAGSIYTRAADLPGSGMSTAAQMLAGAVGLIVLGTAFGEWGHLDLAGVSARSALGLFYLVVFGSIIAYSAYVWLLRVSTPAKVSTYAYVNPVVAVMLGWLFAGEALTMRMAGAAAVIIVGVALITLRRQPRRTETEPDRTTPERPIARGRRAAREERAA